MKYIATVNDKTGLPRAWGVASTPADARYTALEQAGLYMEKHPDNPLDWKGGIHVQPLKEDA